MMMRGDSPPHPLGMAAARRTLPSDYTAQAKALRSRAVTKLCQAVSNPGWGEPVVELVSVPCVCLCVCKSVCVSVAVSVFRFRLRLRVAGLSSCFFGGRGRKGAVPVPVLGCGRGGGRGGRGWWPRPFNQKGPFSGFTHSSNFCLDF